MASGQWLVASGPAVGLHEKISGCYSGQWLAVSGQWLAVSGQWRVASGRATLLWQLATDH